MHTLCILLTILQQQQPADEPAPQLVNGISRELTDTLRIELQRVSRVEALSDADSEAILVELAEPIGAAALRYAKQAGRGLARPEVPDQELSGLLASQIAQRAGDEASDWYLGDVSQRRFFWKESLVTGSLVVIDCRVSLTREQVPRIRKAAIVTGCSEFAAFSMSHSVSGSTARGASGHVEHMTACVDTWSSSSHGCIRSRRQSRQPPMNC